MNPTITAFKWVPAFARGFVRDIRARWAFEEAGQPYAVDLVAYMSPARRPAHQNAMADHLAVFKDSAAA